MSVKNHTFKKKIIRKDDSQYWINSNSAHPTRPHHLVKFEQIRCQTFQVPTIAVFEIGHLLPRKREKFDFKERFVFMVNSI